MKLLPNYFKFVDSRGQILGLSQDSWGEFNYVETQAGTTRGGHYHAETTELFFIISGSVKVETKDLLMNSCGNVVIQPLNAFIIEPFEIHWLTAESDCSWINVLSKPMNGPRKDFHQV